MSFLDRGRTNASTTKAALASQPTSNIFLRHPNLFIAIVALAVTLAVGGSVIAGIMSAETVALRKQMSAETVSVVVAGRDLVMGETLDEATLRIADVPQPFVSKGALRDLSLIIGRELIVAVRDNTQITADMLSGEGNVSSLAFAVNPGMVATSIAVTMETGLAGLLHPGDRVDLLVQGEVIANSVRVLALDSSLNASVNGYTTVTLELTSEVACVLQFSQDSGERARLTLHPASETEVGE